MIVSLCLQLKWAWLLKGASFIDNRVNEGDRKLPFAGLLFPLNLYCSLATQPTYPYNAERRLKDQLTRANFYIYSIIYASLDVYSNIYGYCIDTAFCNNLAPVLLVT